MVSDVRFVPLLKMRLGIFPLLSLWISFHLLSLILLSMGCGGTRRMNCLLQKNLSKKNYSVNQTREVTFKTAFL